MASEERQANIEISPWWGEHLHRYEEALKRLKPKSKVLDIACGTGYGSNLFFENGHTIVGGDISEAALEVCKNKYSEKLGLDFRWIDGTKIPFPDDYFDAVISFETIEHTIKFKEMLLEFKRVVRKDGLIIISTPNFKINSPKGVIVNPFHTQEWTQNEFKVLLHSILQEVRLYGQKYIRYKKKNIAKFTEELLYTRGIRKLPIAIQDKIMNFTGGTPMYPVSSDYELTLNEREIEDCKTFFAVCTP